jgi:hypothetical protein
MNQEEAQAVISDLLSREKKEKKTPYGDVYIDSVKQRERIRAHSDLNFTPAYLFKDRSPNSTKEQMDYVLKNYRCTTFPVWADFLSVVGRSFIDTNWSITWEDGSDGLREYTEEDFPKWGSLEYFVTANLPSIKLNDAMGMLAIRPIGFNINDEGRLVDTEELSPAVYYHRSESVLVRKDDYVVCVGDDKSKVEEAGKVVEKGRILYIYTPEYIYKFAQVGKIQDNKYEIVYSYEHGEEKMPVRELAGVPYIRDDGSIFWVSPFRYSVDLLDLALKNRNIMQVSTDSVVFPFRIMMGDECDFTDDDKGRCVSGKLGDGSSCPSCKGGGLKVPYSPTSAFLWKPPSNIEGGSMPYKPVDFVEAPTGNLEFLRDQVEIDTQKARQILHLHTSNSSVKGSEDMTATGMSIDREAQFSFIRNISNQLFDIWEWMLDRISWQRYGNYDQVPTIIRPTSFDFRTEVDIWEQIKLARESEAPIIMLQGLFSDLLSTIHSADPIKRKQFETIAAADQLFAMSATDIALHRENIEPWRLVLHYRAEQILDELIREDPNFLMKDLSERISDLQNKAESFTFTRSNAADDIAAELIGA